MYRLEKMIGAHLSATFNNLLLPYVLPFSYTAHHPIQNECRRRLFPFRACATAGDVGARRIVE